MLRDTLNAISLEQRKQHSRSIVTWCLSNTSLWYDLWKQEENRAEYGEFAVNLVATRGHLRCLDRRFLQDADLQQKIEEFLRRYKEAGEEDLVTEALKHVDPSQTLEEAERLFASDVGNGEPMDADELDDDDFLTGCEEQNIVRKHIEQSLVLCEAAGAHSQIMTEDRQSLDQRRAAFDRWLERHLVDFQNGIGWTESILQSYDTPESLLEKVEPARSYASLVERMRQWVERARGGAFVEVDGPCLVPLHEYLHTAARALPASVETGETESELWALSARTETAKKSVTIPAEVLEQVFDRLTCGIMDSFCQVDLSLIGIPNRDTMLIEVRVNSERDLDGWEFCLQGRSERIRGGRAELPLNRPVTLEAEIQVRDPEGNNHSFWVIVE